MTLFVRGLQSASLAWSKCNGITTSTFAYNGFGARTSKTDSTGTRTYLRDGVGVTSPLLADGAATYTPGISERRGSTTTYQLDGLKSTLGQIDANGGHVSSRNYDAFGAVTSSSGTHQGPFGYGGAYGYQTDPDTGLMLLGHRYYDSSTGRFLTRDPIKDGRNWYGYCGNEPIGYVDDEGLQRSRLLRAFADWIKGLFRSKPRPRTKPPMPVVGAPPPIHVGKQGKHIPGNKNYIPGRSPITVDPEDLIRIGAGKGTPVNAVPRGEPGFRERVSYPFVIGKYRNPETGDLIDTKNGMIIYDKDGKVHIVPVRP